MVSAISKSDGAYHAAIIALKHRPKNPLLEIDKQISALLQSKSPFAADLTTVQNTLRSTPSFSASSFSKNILDNAYTTVSELIAQFGNSYIPGALTLCECTLREIIDDPSTKPRLHCESRDWGQYAFQIMLDSQDPNNQLRTLVSSSDFESILYNLCSTRNVEMVRQAIALGAKPKIEMIYFSKQEGDLKGLIDAFFDAGVDFNTEKGLRELVPTLRSLPLDLVQFLIERGFKVNGVIRVVSVGRALATVTPLSDAIWKGNGPNKTDRALFKKIEEHVQLLIFNGALSKPPGVSDDYESDIFNTARTMLLPTTKRCIESDSKELQLKETHEDGQLSDILPQAFLYTKIFNACLDGQLRIPSPMPTIVENLFREYCQIDPLPTDMYGIIGEYAGAWGIPRSYLRLYFSESNILKDVIKYCSKDGKFPAKTNLANDKAPAITIEELADARLVDTRCIS